VHAHREVELTRREARQQRLERAFVTMHLDPQPATDRVADRRFTQHRAIRHVRGDADTAAGVEHRRDEPVPLTRVEEVELAGVDQQQPQLLATIPAEPGIQRA
jgi:hypothetical protein